MMKKTSLMFAFVMLASLYQLTVQSNPNSGPSYLWETLTHDFGKIPRGEPVSVTFKFKNNGTSPLIIKNAKASCGCTVADFSKEAVAPAGDGYVKLTYNAAKTGKFTKTVDVNSNVEGGPATVTITGEVVN